MAGLIELKINYFIPNNWTIIKIKPFIKILNGYPFAADRFTDDKNKGNAVVRIRDILNGFAATYTDEFCPEEQQINNGNILIGMDGDFNVNKWRGGQAYLNQRVCSIKVDQRIIMEDYLYYFLPGFLQNVNEITPSVTVKHLSVKTLENLQLPLAPLEEQKRIVEIIEKQFAKLDEARDLIQKSLDSFACRKSTILHKAFTGELTKRWREEHTYKNWYKTTLSQIAKWGSGGTPSRKHTEYYTGNIPWVKTGELNNSYVLDTEEKITQQALNNSSAKLYPIGTVIVAMYGATIGQCAILGVEATTNQACACAVVNEKIMNNRFLFYYLLSQKNNFISLGKGGAQPNISQTVIKDYPINVPSIEEQEEIVRILDSILEKEDKSKELIDMLDKIDEMKKSILARAFRGELGTNNPKDEPAIELLRKILAQSN